MPCHSCRDILVLQLNGRTFYYWNGTWGDDNETMGVIVPIFVIDKFTAPVKFTYQTLLIYFRKCWSYGIHKIL